jgi:hypothetical protein
MYLENKYTRWYYAIIIAAQSQNRKKNNGVYYENHHNKTWTETAIKTRLDNCLKNASKRKGVKNPKHGKKMFINYVNKNKLIFNKIWEMFDQGKNRRQIALELNISWDRINIAINNKEKVLNIIDNYYYDRQIRKPF